MLAKQYALVTENALLYDKLRKKHVALEKANAEITILSITDPLTGIYNRGYLTERIPQEIKRAARYGHSLSIIMCDIDHFKRINDTYGHIVGDQVLKQFVQVITGLIRFDVDWMARYGGEEFVVVLPVTDLEGAIHQAERLRTGIAKRPFNVDDYQIDVTASFGVTGFKSEDPSKKTITPELVITTVDKYLYEAKEQGRNRVVGGPVCNT
jgi:diguanylate cyclase (GGDEF)-like protein